MSGFAIGGIFGFLVAGVVDALLGYPAGALGHVFTACIISVGSFATRR